MVGKLLSVLVAHWAGVVDVKKYVVDLDKEEKERLKEITAKGTSKARRLRRAHILLLADEGLLDREIARAINSAVTTVERTRKRFVEEGLEAALSERSRPGAMRKLDGHQEAYLVALACSEAPEGKKRWSMQLLADRLVEIGMVEEISDETVRRTLKRGTSNRGQRNSGASPRWAQSLCGAWRMYWSSTRSPTTRRSLLCALTSCPFSWCPRLELPYLRSRASRRVTTTSTSVGARPTCSPSSSPRDADATWRSLSGAREWTSPTRCDSWSTSTTRRRRR